MPRSAPRRPSPIALPNCPMDTLWEVDESSPELEMTHQFQPSRRPSASSWFASPPSTGPLRSIFEDDDDEEEDDDLRFPLPPRSVPSKSMSLPIQAAPQSQRTPSPTKSFTPSPRSSSLYAPRRTPPAVPFPTRERVHTPPTPVTPPRRHNRQVQRPVSPTSSASSSDTEPPRTPPAASTCLPSGSEKPVRILPPTEWESAIDALYASDSDEEDEQPSFVQPRPVKRSSIVRAAPPPMPTRAPPPPPRSRARPQSRYEEDDDSRSYLSWSPVSSPGPLSPTQLPMSPMFGRALNSPGFMPTSPTSDHGHSFTRPPRSSRRITAVPERSMIPVELLFSTS